MQRTNGPLARRAGPTFGAGMLLVATLLAFSPIVPPAGAVDPTPSPGASPSPLPQASSSTTPKPSPTPTPTPRPDPSPSPSPLPSPVATSKPTPTPAVPSGALRADIRLTSDAPKDGRHRVEPGARVTLTIDLQTRTTAPDARLVAALPAGWSVVRAEGGAPAGDASSVEWRLGDLPRGSRVVRRIVVGAPAGATAGSPAFDAAFRVHLQSTAGVAVSPSLAVRVAPELVVEHATFARIGDVSHRASYLSADAPLEDVLPLDRFRVRFQVRNADLVKAGLEPWLEVRRVGDDTWQRLTADPATAMAFFLGDEWRAAPGGKGTVVGPVEETIAVDDLRLRDRDDKSQVPAVGRRLMGPATPPRIAVAGDTYTEIEFAVRVGFDAPYGRSFELRITDAGVPITGATVARVSIGPRPTVELSPGQRRGIDVPGPADATASAWGSVDYPLAPPDMIAAGYAESSAGEPRYQLAVAAPPAPVAAFPLDAPGDSPHLPDTSLVSDTCSACHRSHSAVGPYLVNQPVPQSTLCFTCHNEAGDVQEQYATAPANDPANGAYYRHDATALSTHTAATEDEFGGVSNRHSACGDCHNSHNATAAVSTQTTTGWTVPGRMTTISGVAVANGAAGTAPAYTLLGGSIGSQPTREYEVCFKCHSGWTVLPAQDPARPSRWALDKAIEFNPANVSYHPVEAPGKNTTTAMGLSLSGTSPYKQWNFTTGSTIRCVNCHGDPDRYNATTPPAPGSDLAPHTSQYRGILLQNYRDRVLKGAEETYAAADAALCLVCHAEGPFLDRNSPATNFRLHQEHVAGLAGKGSGGTDIDTAGAGQGNSLCSECHFRVHGSALKYGSQGVYPRLINFAPNVQAYRGTLSWAARTGGGGSCTLVCHDKDHNQRQY